MATTYSNIVKSPVKGATSVTVSSPFGPRTAPLAGMHNGVDISQPKNMIVAIERGIITDIRNTVKTSQTKDIIANQRTSLYNGNYIVVKHGQGYETRHFHLLEDSFKYKVGEIVPAGAEMAMMGSTGYTTGVHLHFEVRKDGVAVDPMPFLLGQKSIAPYEDPSVTYLPALPRLKVNVSNLRYRKTPNGELIGNLAPGALYPYIGYSNIIAGYSWAQIIVDNELVFAALNPEWNEVVLPAPKEVILPFSAKVEKDGMVLTVDLQPVSK